MTNVTNTNFRIMRIILAMAITLPMMLMSCSDDSEDSGKQTFFVNVYSKPNSIYGEKELVNYAFVYIYENENKEIDGLASSESVVEDGVLTYVDGNKSSRPKYATSFQPGVFNLENITNGDYILWVTYMTDFKSSFYSSFKNIIVNYDYRLTTEEKTFMTSIDDKGIYRYQEW